jgi:hypothetical protein
MAQKHVDPDPQHCWRLKIISQKQVKCNEFIRIQTFTSKLNFSPTKEATFTSNSDFHQHRYRTFLDPRDISFKQQ